jgi:hypothetical protein
VPPVRRARHRRAPPRTAAPLAGACWDEGSSLRNCLCRRRSMAQCWRGPAGLWQAYHPRSSHGTGGGA